MTVGPLVDLWRKAGETNVPPTEEALAEARRKVGSDKLILDEKNRTVRFAVEGMRIDLGGIGKGYAVDKAVEAMQKQGAVGGMVDLGGNIRCFGRPPHGQDALAHRSAGSERGLRMTLGPSKPLLVLALTSESVATSGDYRRFVKVQGQKQSHIIDTATGKGANKLVSDTIIAADATTADALSTVVNVLGLEKGLALIERLPCTEAILIPGQGHRLSTVVARKHISPRRHRHLSLMENEDSPVSLLQVKGLDRLARVHQNRGRGDRMLRAFETLQEARLMVDRLEIS